MKQRLKHEILNHYRIRYKSAKRKKKIELLNHICEIQGYNRKSAIRLLNGVERDTYGKPKPGRRRKYGSPELLEALQTIWLATDQMGSKRLEAAIRLWLPYYEKHYGVLSGDILRFMATIKLKEASASVLLKRLSSYAKDHPLYKAIKEFGRIIKSQYILTYIDELSLRQHIEKQLNKVELSNKFAKAVFFEKNQEFTVATREEQEIVASCKSLIQSAIVLWNSLYLSQLILSAKTRNDKTALVKIIQSGSMLTWQHVNMRGEYDFTKAANSTNFDLSRILALKVEAVAA